MKTVDLDCSILLNDRYYERTQRRRRNVERWVRSYWAEPLDMLLAFSGQLTVWGEQLLSGHLESANARPVFVRQLARLYVSACRVTDGICVLLAAGHADEAMGRWRTLFEHSVIAKFLSQGDEDLARRYYSHHVKASLRAQKDYRRHHQRLGAAPPNKGEEEETRKLLKDYKQRYGAGFAADYGWAGNQRFFDLAQNVGLDYLMPYYGMGAALLRRRPKGLLPAARQELLDPSKAWWGGRRGRLADWPPYSISVSLGVVPRWYSRVVESQYASRSRLAS